MAEYRILCCFPGCTNIAEVIVGDEMPAGSIGRRHIFCPAHETKACEICGGTGTYVMPSAFEDEHGNVIETESRLLCHGCNGTGKAAYSQSSLFDNVDQNDIVFHPQTGEKLLIPQVCCECGSGNLGHYTVRGDFLPTDGWRICGDCEAINSPMCVSQVCPDCLGYGGHYLSSAGVAYTSECSTCGGTGRRRTPCHHFAKRSGPRPMNG